MKTSVIMPMYNEANIFENINNVVATLDKINKDFEIILVNDGSKNNCFKEAKKIKDRRVRVVGYDKNMGKGYAIKYGFSYAKGDYITFLDCGEDIEASQIKEFLRIIKFEKADIVVGSKRHPDSKVDYPFSRRFMSGIYQIINKVLFNLDVRDTQVGLKLFKRKVLEEIMPKIAIKKFAFDLELLVIANKKGFKIIEAPIILKYKFRSSINSKAVFWMLWDTAAIFYRDKILNYYD
jgi:glycosyltransferase involved in cell wall biosynthesis